MKAVRGFARDCQLEIGPVDTVRHGHEPHQVDRAIDAIQIAFPQRELSEEKICNVL